MRGLYRGVAPRIGLGIWQTVCMVSFADYVKAWYGLSHASVVIILTRFQDQEIGLGSKGQNYRQNLLLPGASSSLICIFVLL